MAWDVPSRFNDKEVMSMELVLQDSKASSLHLEFFYPFFSFLVHHIEHPSFPLDAFRLKSFKELLTADKLDDSELIGKTSVQNHLYVSKLHINDGLKEVVGFRNRFLSRVPTSFSRISQVSSQGGWSGADEINQGVVLVKTIEQELNVKEVRYGYVQV
ncbi:hypothetical protein AHAS_Ahas12G0089600 [Arachis hypogaea]